MNTRTLVTSVSLSHGRHVRLFLRDTLFGSAHSHRRVGHAAQKKSHVGVPRRVFWLRSIFSGARTGRDKMLDTPHISTVALACVAACSPWFWSAHRAWQTQRVSPATVAATDALMLGVVLVCLAVLAITLPTMSTIIEMPSR